MNSFILFGLVSFMGGGTLAWRPPEWPVWIRMLIQEREAQGMAKELVMRNMSMFRLVSWKLTGSHMLSMTFNLALSTSTLSHVSNGLEATFAFFHRAIEQRGLDDVDF